MQVPWINQKTLKDEADGIISLLEGVMLIVPGGARAVPTVTAVKMLIDNDSLRPALVDLLNRATGAQPPP